MLEWTGERFLPYIGPSVCGSEIHYEHLHRYAFASQFTKGKKVLDLGSGEGFGTAILAKNAESVVGIDIDHNAVLHASNSYIKENISFIEGSIINMPIVGTKIFDVIVCFEAIEHIQEHALVFKEILRLLSDDGILIISTPNKKTYSDDTGYKNPYHLHELYYSEFIDLLKKYFSHIHLSGQRVFSGSSISPVSNREITSVSEYAIELKGNQFSFLEEDNDLPSYFIAIASNKEQDPTQLQKSYLVDKSNAEFVRLNALISDRETAIQSLNQNLSNKVNQIKDAQEKILSLSEIITSKDQQLRASLAQVQDLAGKIQDYIEQVQSLSQNVSMKDLQLQEMTKQAEQNRLATTTKDLQLQEMTKQAEQSRLAATTKDQGMQELNAHIVSLNQKISAIESSIVWQLTMKFHRKIIEKILPIGSRRRMYYDLSLKWGRILISEGGSSFRSQINDRQVHNVMSASTYRKYPEPIVTVYPERDVAVINTSVSVIIPTKNAGHDFDYVLNKISKQMGIQETEIVIVDSGSTDETLEIAEKYHANIIRIKPEEFDHGKTRNLGASHAKGQYILFTTQDALFASNMLIHDMVVFLQKDEKIAAVTCRQIPRSDADFMACFQVWSHYCRFLNIDSDKIVSAKNLNISPHEKRKMANLSDSCCCMKRDLFLRYLYKVNFAEDLELGLRLLSDGNKLAYMYSVAIIHSHNRPAAYFFKANYTDFKLVSQILENPPMDWGVKSLEDLYREIRHIYFKLSSELFHTVQSGINDPVQFLTHLRHSLSSSVPQLFHLENSDNSLDILFTDIDKILSYEENIKCDPEQYVRLINIFIISLDSFSEYCKNFKSIEEEKEDFIATIYKIFACSAGSSLGNHILYLETQGRKDPVCETLDQFLRKGV